MPVEHRQADLEHAKAALARDGFRLIQKCIGPDQLRELRAIYNQTNGLDRLSVFPKMVLAHLRANGLARFVQRLSAGNCHLVRMIAFQKNSQRNWFVPWHQDRTVALRVRHEANGFSRWTCKKGIPHAEAPVSLLDRMLTMRIHLDKTSLASGPLEVLPQTHTLGRLNRQQISTIAKTMKAKICTAEPGDVLLMKPLLVHRSMRTEAPERRVLHLEFSPDTLPSPLEWHMSRVLH